MRSADIVTNLSRTILFLFDASPIMAHVLGSTFYALKPVIRYGQPNSSIIYNGKPGSKYALRLTVTVPLELTRLAEGDFDFVRQHGDSTTKSLTAISTYPALNTLFSMGLKLYSYKPAIINAIDRHLAGEEIEQLISSMTTEDEISGIIRLIYTLDKINEDLVLLQSDVINEHIKVDPQLFDYVQKHILFSTIEKVIRELYTYIILSNIQTIESRMPKDNPFVIEDRYDKSKESEILNLYRVHQMLAQDLIEQQVVDSVRALNMPYFEFALYLIPKILDDMAQNMPAQNQVQNPQQGNGHQQQTCSGGACQNQGQNQNQGQGQNQGQSQTQNQNTVPNISNVTDLIQYYLQNSPDLILVEDSTKQGSMYDSNTLQNIADTINVIQEFVSEKFRGIGSSQIEHYLGNVKEFNLDWLKKLKSSILTDVYTDKLQKDVIYTKPNKLLMWYTSMTKIVFPSQVDYEKEYHFIITIDESGSMGNEELRYIGYLLEEANKIGSVYVVKHDYKVVFEKEYPKNKGGCKKDITEASRYRHSCGGTSHNEVFAFVEEYLKRKKFLKRANSKAYVIVASDMCSDIPHSLKEHELLLNNRVNIYFLAQKREYIDGLIDDLRKEFGQLHQNWYFIAIEEK